MFAIGVIARALDFELPAPLAQLIERLSRQAKRIVELGGAVTRLFVLLLEFLFPFFQTRLFLAQRFHLALGCGCAVGDFGLLPGESFLLLAQRLAASPRFL